MKSFILSILLLLSAGTSLMAQTTDAEWHPFEPGVISTPEWKEGSPSVTADGNTLVFARYRSYGSKVPYVARRTSDGWAVERLTFIDTLYNLAIAPDGQDIFFKARTETDSGTVAQAYRVRRGPDGDWGEPEILPGPLYQNAGYFRVARDGTLYMYINAVGGNTQGIYYAEPRPDGFYGPPQWLSDAVSPYPTTTYSPLPSPDETQIIVNRGGMVEEAVKEKLGPKGLHLHQLHNGRWDTGVRLEGIPYTWYAEILPDERLLFVYEGDLYTIPLERLTFDWN